MADIDQPYYILIRPWTGCLWSLCLKRSFMLEFIIADPTIGHQYKYIKFQSVIMSYCYHPCIFRSTFPQLFIIYFPGGDNRAIVEVVASRTRSQRLEIAKKYKEKQGRVRNYHQFARTRFSRTVFFNPLRRYPNPQLRMRKNVPGFYQTFSKFVARNRTNCNLLKNSQNTLAFRQQCSLSSRQSYTMK